MKVIILGPPGSGKGTLSTFLVEKFGFYHLSTGDILREEINNNTEIAVLAKDYLEKGLYVPDTIINEMVAKKIGQINNHIIFDGYPRTIAQAQFLQNYLKELQQRISLVIYLKIDSKVLIKRILTRLVCSQCKRSYNIATMPPQEANTCDYDGSKLFKRSDDGDVKKIQIRLNEYNKETAELIGYYKNLNLLYELNVNQSTMLMHQQLKNVIEACHD